MAKQQYPNIGEIKSGKHSFRINNKLFKPFQLYGYNKCTECSPLKWMSLVRIFRLYKDPVARIIESTISQLFTDFFLSKLILPAAITTS